MTFDNLTQADAIRIREVLTQLTASDTAATQTTRVAERVVVQAWWDTIKPAVPTTRTEALAVYQFIEDEIVTQKTNVDNETNPTQKRIFEVRVAFLREKLEEANEKFKEVKKASV